jgi:hypothetical protein
LGQENILGRILGQYSAVFLIFKYFLVLKKGFS